VDFHLFHILIKIYVVYKVKIGLKETNYQSISNLLVYYTKELQFLSSTYHKFNVGINVFEMKDKKNSIIPIINPIILLGALNPHHNC
jgi:hypothetical protein